MLRLLLLLLCSTPTLAADYVAQQPSQLGFTAEFQGEAFEGRFARFTPAIRFDPDDLAGSRFDVRIELASADTDNEERDELLLGGDFFAVGDQPDARYVATRFKSLGNGRYVAEGELSLRGVTKAVPLTFSWTPGSPTVLEGEATLDRLAFKVGVGDWSDTGLLPASVKVTTRLLLMPRK
ncbi:MAG TPA: YceI family protein [Arenimonas sp.]|nr:YceI family protein [Arenimonas sp.]